MTTQAKFDFNANCSELGGDCRFYGHFEGFYFSGNREEPPEMPTMTDCIIETPEGVVDIDDVAKHVYLAVSELVHNEIDNMHGRGDIR